MPRIQSTKTSPGKIMRSAGPVVIKKDDEPLLNLTGAPEPLLKREGAYVYKKNGTIESPL